MWKILTAHTLSENLTEEQVQGRVAQEAWWRARTIRRQGKTHEIATLHDAIVATTSRVSQKPTDSLSKPADTTLRTHRTHRYPQNPLSLEVASIRHYHTSQTKKAGFSVLKKAIRSNIGTIIFVLGRSIWLILMSNYLTMTENTIITMPDAYGVYARTSQKI